MTYSHEQRKSAYNKLPWKVQDFIMDNDTTDLIKSYINKIDFNEENKDLADSEILYSLLGLQELQDAISNIAKTSKKSEGELIVLKKDLQDNIFKKIDELYLEGDGKVVTVTMDKYIENRITEIAKKYELDEKQKASRINIISTLSISPNDRVNMLDEITTKLEISGLIAEQILEDLESRVFSYSLKSLEKLKPSQASPVTETKTKQNITTKIPGVRPDNLPIESNPSNRPGVSSVPNYNYTPRPKVVVDEPVQTPISVPRFKAVPLDEGESVGRDFIPTLAPKPNAGGIMDSKLNSITKSVESTPTQSPAPQKYTSDPYREPLS